MSWRDIIVGAIVTLIVTVVGGLMVWYITEENKKDINKERLVYSYDTYDAIKNENSTVSILTLRVENIGLVGVRNLKIQLNFPPGSQVEEVQSASSAGGATVIEKIVSDDRRIVKFGSESILPAERFMISMLLRGASAKPDISIKGDNIIATLEDLIPKQRTLINKLSVKDFIVPFLVAAFAPIPLFILTRRLLSRLLSSFGSQNNTAFVLMHKKMPDQAAKILSNKILTKGAGVYEIANFGLATGLQGNIDDAERYFAAAEWWARENNIRSVIAFNRSVLYISQRDFETAANHLNLAFSNNKSQVARYCNLSSYIQEAANSDNRIAQILIRNNIAIISS